jgi:chromosome partitioning protein
MGRGARGADALRRHPAGRDGGADAGLHGRSLSPWRQDFTALIGQAGEQIAGIYEADYRDFNRETYARGRAAFDETYAGFKRLLIGAWHRDAGLRADHAAAE